MFDIPKQTMRQVSKCLVYPYAKQTKIQFPSSSINSGACFDLIHFELWGPFNSPKFDGNKYFIIIVDDYSQIIWLFLLRNKSDVCISL